MQKQKGVIKMAMLFNRWDKVYETHCPDCDASIRVRVMYRMYVPGELRKEGWAMRSGLWYCPNCKSKPGSKQRREK